MVWFDTILIEYQVPFQEIMTGQATNKLTDIRTRGGSYAFNKWMNYLPCGSSFVLVRDLDLTRPDLDSETVSIQLLSMG